MSDDIPQWAKERACALSEEVRREWGITTGPYWMPEHVGEPRRVESLTALARYIAEHEEPPADPLLTEARERAAFASSLPNIQFIDGHRDNERLVQFMLETLERGAEMAREIRP